MNTLASTRDDFVAYIRRQLVGPFGGSAEIIFDPPNRRYLMGILFPRQVSFAGYVEGEGEELDEAATGGGDESQFSDDPVSAANDFLPASQGLSFFTTATSLEVTASAAEYETLSGKAANDALAAAEAQDGGPTEEQDEDPRHKAVGSARIWRRSALPSESVTLSEGGSTPTPIWGGKAELHVRWRSYPRGKLVTVTLVNARESDDEHPERAWDNMLLQVDFRVRVGSTGEILEYPNVAMASHDPEEEELRLIHRDARVYAIGHGCSPDWTSDADGRVLEVRSEVMPQYVVPRVSALGQSVQALDIAWLGDETVADADLVDALDEFIDPYENWIETVSAKASTLDSRYANASHSILERLVRAKERMRDGVRLFAEAPERASLIEAFHLANRAMLLQMRHSKEDLAGARHARRDAPDIPGEYPSGAKWHPFQLGFFLTTVRGLADPAHDDRDVVDLIWFPTGGGKTEAYLLVAAFEIFRRRLVHGEQGGGTAVLSRYTLSLLTAQQFQRTASTIAACEHLRRSVPERLGDEPISAGLWVGKQTTENRFLHAHEKFEELRDSSETDDRFLLERCPWCGTEIVPRVHTDDDDDYGIDSTDRSFAFHCTSGKCEFHSGLPIHVIDEALYESPPTFLLGTVDKFAQLAWVPEAGSLFGGRSGKQPPSLVIQDELHLLTGPLGTTVGLYEAAINLLCEWDGRPPKVISSTATIRRAGSQIMGLFGRPVDLFPPSGIDSDDSFFAQVDRDHPGRLYVGMMAQGHTSDTAVVQSGAALLQAPVDLELADEAKDAYWTVVAYHSSLRELGRTVTIARDDIQARLGGLIVGRDRRVYDVDELSSSVPRAQQPRLLERLNRPCTDANSVDFLATTNMLSVGVDVPRLGLMLVNGQPKATAEYIQATSRVGRSSAPGLVFGLFRSTKPRDRSHYENFRSYHSALYRHVEPTTVTPFSPPSRDRALHAALVILVRHRLGLAAEGKAGEILQHESQVRALAAQLVTVVERVEPRERAGAEKRLERFIEDWLDRARQAERESKLLHYRSAGRGQLNLIKQFNEAGSGWPTLGSMRNVDMESLVEVQRGNAGGAN